MFRVGRPVPSAFGFFAGAPLVCSLPRRGAVKGRPSRGRSCCPPPVFALAACDFPCQSFQAFPLMSPRPATCRASRTSASILVAAT